jgi:single-stranded-DNA-specific exonuclease
MGTSWRLRSLDAAAVREVTRRNNVTEVVARFLVARGHAAGEATARHLDASLHALHDPGSLPGMEAAAERIGRAVERGETILVHGDYDVDGVTGTVLLMRLFALIGARAVWHIPHRLTDGYSFGTHSVDKARECGASLVVSVDNGTSARETIAALRAVGVDTIVTDHHEPPRGELPPAVAIVNPKLPDSAYPFRELCGAGVAFKLAWGVAQRISGARKVREDLRSFLADAMSYVAIATVCDVVPLVDENRVLARRGLLALEATKNIGLRALLEASGLGAERLVAEDVGFKLGPRLNAAGRLASAALAVEMLLSNDAEQARALAGELDSLNDERRRIEAEITAQALEQARRYEDPARHPVLVLAGADWHPGVVGIVASRVVARYRRPALVIGVEGTRGRGSARSVDGFDVLEALHGASSLFERYGGHAQAAGCEIELAKIDAMRAAVCARATELLERRVASAHALWIDAQLPLAHVGPELMGQIDRLEPFGAQNEKPVLCSLDVRLAEPARLLGADRTHLMLRVRHGERVLKAMAFGMGARAGELALGAPLHVVYTPRWNTFRGERNLELVLHDFAVGAPPALA